MPDLVFDPSDEAFNMKVHSFEIEYEDVFSLQNLYDQIYLWVVENGFTSVESDDDQFETLYQHSISNDGSVEHRIWWRVDMESARADYFKYFLKIDFRTINMSKVKVDHNGKQVSAHKGDVIIRAEAWLLLDANRTWRDSSWSYLHRFFRTRYQKQINEEEAMLYGLASDLQSNIKNFLDLKNPTPQKELFHPKHGL